MLYRALDRLSIGVERFQVFLHTQITPENAAILLRKKRIVVVNEPPLLVLMPEQAETFNQLGVSTFSELLECKQANEELKRAALDILNPPQKCGHCRR